MESKKTSNNSMATQEAGGDNRASQELLSLSQWKEAPDWSELLKLNMKFLKSNTGSEEMPNIPYSADFGREDLTPRLIDLHKYGLFIISSQGMQLPEQFSDLGKWKERKQAQYLEFFVPYKETNINFITNLFKDNQLQGVAFDWAGGRLTGSSENDIEVAWCRESTAQESLEVAEWEWEAFIPVTYSRDNYTKLANIKAFGEARPAFCAFTMLENQADLLECIQKHVTAAGLRKSG